MIPARHLAALAAQERQRGTLEQAPKPPDGGGAGKSATTVRASEEQAVRRG